MLTGETGAGKSMLVDALSLVLGGGPGPSSCAPAPTRPRSRPSSSVPAGVAGCWPGSRRRASPASGELVVRRVVSVAQARQELRSRAYVNGRLCTAAQLAELAADLCDIASQHESVTLTDPATHVDYLDAFGKLEAERAELAEQVEALGPR